MSNYLSKALNPRTYKIEQVHIWDDWFHQHEYGVRFSDGNVYPENQIVCIHPDDLYAEDVRVFYQGEFGIIFSTPSGYLYSGMYHKTVADACVNFKIDVDDMRRNK